MSRNHKMKGLSILPRQNKLLALANNGPRCKNLFDIFQDFGSAISKIPWRWLCWEGGREGGIRLLDLWRNMMLSPREQGSFSIAFIGCGWWFWSFLCVNELKCIEIIWTDALMAFINCYKIFPNIIKTEDFKKHNVMETFSNTSMTFTMEENFWQPSNAFISLHSAKINLQLSNNVISVSWML